MFYLVQEFVAGPTLAAELTRRRYTEDEVLAILDELAEVLAYLHRLMPPVVHRDLKLKNVIRRSSDQKLVLIDFGAVRDVVADPRVGGSTVAGTYGYMAPEQFRGEASPQSDLYALGVLGVVLLSAASLVDLARPGPQPGLAGPRHRVESHAAPARSPAPGRSAGGRRPPRPSARPSIASAGHPVVAAAGSPLPAPRPARPAARSARLPGDAAAVVRPCAAAGGHRIPRRAALVVPGPPVPGGDLGHLLPHGHPLAASLLHALILWRAGPGAFNERYNAALLALEADRAARLTQQLEALHALHLKGALTPEEFEREKALLLDHQPDALATLLQGFQRGGFDHAEVCSGRSASSSACRSRSSARCRTSWRAGIAAGGTGSVRAAGSAAAPPKNVPTTRPAAMAGPLRNRSAPP
ncbi:MAG: protein kinase [bacterium]